MMIIPAVDILGGQAVQLRQGDFDHVAERRGNPVELAREWAAAGARLIHVVDLDGARAGHRVNAAAIERICHTACVPIQVGGGLRNADDVAAVLEGGAARAVLGTAALKSPELLRNVVARWGERIVVGIDARDGYVATEGWREGSVTLATDFAREVAALGVKYIVYTDISRDGTLEGPNLTATGAVARAAGFSVIASGGVGTLDDLRALHGTSGVVAGVIIGRAIYSGAIDLAQAIAEMQDAQDERGVQGADQTPDPLP